MADIKKLIMQGKTDEEIKKIISDEAEMDESVLNQVGGELEEKSKEAGEKIAKKHFVAIAQDVIEESNKLIKEYEIDTDEAENNVNTIMGYACNKAIQSAMDEYYGKIESKIKAAEKHELAEALINSIDELEKCINDLSKTEDNNKLFSPADDGQVGVIIDVLRDIAKEIPNIKGKIKAKVSKEDEALLSATRSVLADVQRDLSQMAKDKNDTTFGTLAITIMTAIDNINMVIQSEDEPTIDLRTTDYPIDTKKKE